MKKLTILLAILIASLLKPPAATADVDVSMGLYLDGLFLELGGRPMIRHYHPDRRPYYGYPGYQQYYGYPRPPYNYYDYRYPPGYYYGRPPYYDRHYYDYGRRPPYRPYRPWQEPGWGGYPRFEQRYHRRY